MLLSCKVPCLLRSQQQVLFWFILPLVMFAVPGPVTTDQCAGSPGGGASAASVPIVPWSPTQSGEWTGENIYWGQWWGLFLGCHPDSQPHTNQK